MGISPVDVAQIGLINSQKSKTEAETQEILNWKKEKTVAETGFVLANTGNVQADTVLKNSEKDLNELELKLGNATFNDSVELLKNTAKK